MKFINLFKTLHTFKEDIYYQISNQFTQTLKNNSIITNKDSEVLYEILNLLISRIF